MSRIVAINKPVGMTSHDVIDLVRKATGERTVGHAGTLDPLASGVLVVAIGREATRQLGAIVKKEKEYIAEVRLGQTSSTDDEEGEKTEYAFTSSSSLDSHTIQKALASFIGTIKQVPPAYSAIRIKGKRAYSLARQGKEPQLEAREVEIKLIEILDYEFPLLKLRVVTGPGVYIRALARDIGKVLGTGAYLASLERTRVGDYGIKDALPFDQLDHLRLAGHTE